MVMKVVIVSGYFNPLHGGHLDMIESARAMGDKLVFANGDERNSEKTLPEKYVFAGTGNRELA